MRRMGITALGLCAALGIAACGSDKSSSPSATSVTPTSAASTSTVKVADTGTVASADTGTVATGAATTEPAQPACAGDPVTGGSITYARQAETQTLDPLHIRNGNGDIFADGLIYQGLVQYDPTGASDIIGGVAESWTVSPDGLTYTFKLRPGIKFSNGQPVTAEDVKFSLDQFGDPKINEVMSILTTGYKSSTIVDPSTFQVNLSTPVPSFLDNISTFAASILPKDLVQQQGDDFWNHPVGTGPFTVSEFVSGSHVTFVRNPNYWDTGKPYLDKVTFNFAIDGNSRLLSLTSGDVQVADGIAPSQIEAVRGNSDLVLKSFAIPAWIQIFPNHNRPELADQNVRLAIMSALDLKAINDQIFGGLGIIPNSVLPQLKYDAPADVIAPFTFDLDKAKALMAKSAYPSGFSVKLEYPSGIDYFNQLGLLIQQQLSKIGIKVELLKEDPSALLDNWRGEKYDLNFAFPVITSDVAVPDEFALFFGDPEGNHGFHTNFSDPALTTLIKAFVSNPDDASRAKQWPVIQQTFIDQQPMFNILDVPLLNAYATNVCGTDVNALGIDQLQDTWLAAHAG